MGEWAQCIVQKTRDAFQTKHKNVFAQDLTWCLQPCYAQRSNSLTPAKYALLWKWMEHGEGSEVWLEGWMVAGQGGMLWPGNYGPWTDALSRLWAGATGYYSSQRAKGAQALPVIWESVGQGSTLRLLPSDNCGLLPRPYAFPKASGWPIVSWPGLGSHQNFRAEISTRQHIWAGRPSVDGMQTTDPSHPRLFNGFGVEITLAIYKHYMLSLPCAPP